MPGTAMHSCSSYTRTEEQRHDDDCKFETSLVYTASSKPVRATYTQMLYLRPDKSVQSKLGLCSKKDPPPPPPKKN